MKHNYLHKIRKPYHKPFIEEISLDKEISLIMISTPPVEPGPTNPPPPLPTGASTTPDYGTQTYKTKDPFGGSKPVY